MEAERPDRDAAARDYQAVIARVFGVDAGRRRRRRST